MKKLQVVVLALLGVLAVSAMAATAAFAELAEWLANGIAAAGQASKITGELLLEDNKAPIVGKAAVLCNGIILGTVEANGADKATEILNLKEEKITELGGALPLLGEGAGSDCVTETSCAEGSSSSPIEVWPIGLPWTTELVKEGGKWFDLTSSAKEVGYELLCLILGINTEDKCTYAANEKASVEIINDANGDAEIPAGAIAAPLALCSQSGEASGVNQADELANILLENGELLSVS